MRAGIDNPAHTVSDGDSNGDAQPARVVLHDIARLGDVLHYGAGGKKACLALT